MLEDGIVLYHGSYIEIDEIDLSLCDENKDFGQGFYLTTSKRQAVSFIPTSLIKAKKYEKVLSDQNYGYVTEFRIRLNKDVRCFEFDGANKDWLYYISINRRRQFSSKLKKLLSEDFDKYEVLIGKIANDDTNATLTAFLAGAYGDIEEDSAFNMVRSLLKPDRLENQFCFKSSRAVGMLEKTGAQKYEFR